MIGAGTIINPILKVVTTVVILGAVYLFIVRPVLDTTEDLTNSATQQSKQALADADARSEAISLDIATNRSESFANSLRSQWPEASREVTDCVRAANKDAKAMEKCADLGSELTSQGLSPRNVSLSYANSLSAQGDSAGAAQVESCVEEAAVNVKALQRCRDLADRLLFG